MNQQVHVIFDHAGDAQIDCIGVFQDEIFRVRSRAVNGPDLDHATKSTSYPRRDISRYDGKILVLTQSFFVEVKMPEGKEIFLPLPSPIELGNPYGKCP